MANRIEKLLLLDLFITPSRIYVRDEHSKSIFIGGSLMQKMVLKWK
jgi:hypothetical protein